jgi:predicted AAA+ superfamily ATPase
MTHWSYLNRVVDGELTRRLAANGAVLIEGPKACGKTETARRQAASEVLLDIDLAAREAAAIDPGLVLDGPVPRLIDEWQTVVPLWNRVRREVDARKEPGQFILTGSATPADDVMRHTGAGRFGRVRMRPFSLFEAATSTGSVSLADALNGAATATPDPGVTVRDLIEEVVRGGWPGIRGLAVPDAAQAVRDYVEQITRTDISAVDGVRRDPTRVLTVLRSLARHTATQATLKTLASDSDVPAGAGVASYETVSSYLGALGRLMVVEDVPAWNTHLRSSHQLRTSPTRHFVDPSLAVAALRATPDTLLADLNFFGLLFESLVVRDLRVYAQSLDGAVYHYRDQTGLEVDAIVDTGERWGAFEIKLGTNRIDEAASHLTTFAGRIDTTKRGPAAVLAVIVGTGYGYVRSDGVHVIPIGSLGP